MPASKLTVPKSYAALRRSVETVVLKGRQQIERAWVKTYHECGRMIHEHLLLKKDRAAYGAYVYRQLAADTGVDIRTLQQSVQFYRYFPIARHGAQLNWAHYRALVQVDDATLREQLLQDTLRHGWPSTHLIERVRSLNAAAAEAAPSETSTSKKLLTPKRGTPGIYRVVKRGDALAVDLGFKLYVELDDDDEFSAGAFVRFNARGRAVAEDATKADLFTYAAAVSRVVDGDTLAITVALPRGYHHEMKLRLRGLDCPEMDTAEGKTAKRFVEALVANATDVTIYTTKPDKYDRYLADAFLAQPDGEPAFLNNELLKIGHAVRKDEYSLQDWES